MTDAGDFLLPGPTLIVETAVFVIVLVALSRTALPRLRNAIDSHHQRLNIAANEAAEAVAERDLARAEAHAIVAGARREARQILDRANRRHDDIVAEGRRAGREEYEWMAARHQRERARRAASARGLTTTTATTPLDRTGAHHVHPPMPEVSAALPVSGVARPAPSRGPR